MCQDRPRAARAAGKDQRLLTLATPTTAVPRPGDRRRNPPAVEGAAFRPARSRRPPISRSRSNPPYLFLHGPPPTPPTPEPHTMYASHSHSNPTNLSRAPGNNWRLSFPPLISSPLVQPAPNAPYYPPPPGVQPGVSPSHPYAPPGQGGVPPARGAIYQPSTHTRSQPTHGSQGGQQAQGGVGASPHSQGLGAQMASPGTMGPTSGFVPPHRMPYVPGRAPYMPRGPTGLQPIPPPHSMPQQIPQKRRSARIAIIDPKTGQEVTNSPPKESPLDTSSGPSSDGAVSPVSTSPYQHSPPGSMRPLSSGTLHPYAPGTSPSRQPPFKVPDVSTSDFEDQSGPVEQFAPNHPYAPGRSAAIPIEKPPASSTSEALN